MGKVLIGLLFCLVLGLGGLAVAGWLAISGRIIASTDNLFLALVSLVVALACFSYIAWHFYTVLGEDSGKKKRR